MTYPRSPGLSITFSPSVTPPLIFTFPPSVGSIDRTPKVKGPRTGKAPYPKLLETTVGYTVALFLVSCTGQILVPRTRPGPRKRPEVLEFRCLFGE